MVKRILLVLLVIFTALPALAATASVPKYLNYQAALFDEGGNLLPDGKTRLYFRILDAAQKVVYEEEQDVEVVSGAVSVIVGSGVDLKNGAPTGGISGDMLLPDGPRYLEVQAEGHSPEGPMELVSVPYAEYADTAFKVADGAVDSGQIKDGALKIDHFTDELIIELGGRIIGSGDQSTVVVREEFNSYKTSISNSGGGAQVGVTPDFAYSSATNVQNVLKDLDLAIKKRYEDVEKVKESYTAQFVAETLARSNADGTLQSNITTEATTRAQDDSALQGQFTSHVGNTSNPHGVTAEQIGAVSKSDLYSGNDGSDSIIKIEKIPDVVATKEYVDKATGSVSVSECPAGATPIDVRLTLHNMEYGTIYSMPIAPTSTACQATVFGTADQGDAVAVQIFFKGGGPLDNFAPVVVGSQSQYLTVSATSNLPPTNIFLRAYRGHPNTAVTLWKGCVVCHSYSP